MCVIEFFNAEYIFSESSISFRIAIQKKMKGKEVNV